MKRSRAAAAAQEEEDDFTRADLRLIRVLDPQAAEAIGGQATKRKSVARRFHVGGTARTPKGDGEDDEEGEEVKGQGQALQGSESATQAQAQQQQQHHEETAPQKDKADIYRMLLEDVKTAEAADKEEEGSLVQRLHELDALKAEAHGKRWLKHHVETYMQEERKVQARLAEIRSGNTKTKAMKKRVKQFMHMAQRATEVEAASRKEKAKAAAESGSSITAVAAAVAAASASEKLKEAYKVVVRNAMPSLIANRGDLCDECGLPMRVIANDSLLGCPKCATARILPNTTAAAVSHGVEVDYSSSAYHQKSRYVEWMECSQAKEYAEPPEDVMRAAMECVWSQRLSPLVEHAAVLAEEIQARGPFLDAEDAVERLKAKIPEVETYLRQITGAFIRKCLRTVVSEAKDEKIKDRLRKFYERSPKIASYVGGYLPLQMRPDQEEQMFHLFMAAAPIYEKYRKSAQQNWPGGYGYFIRSGCILMGWDEFVSQYPLPAGAKNVKDREELREKIWSNELHWEFTPATMPLPPIKVPGPPMPAAALEEDEGEEEEEEAPAEVAKQKPKRARVTAAKKT